MSIDDKFKELVESGVGCAVIMAGSDSDDAPRGENKDKPSHIELIANSLKQYGIPHEVRICSAHKQPKELADMMASYDALKGPLAIIAVAGGTDALSGTAAFHSRYPVISCPPDAPNNSCLTNPPGSSNAYIANPKNVGRFIAQMFSSINEGYRLKLYEENFGGKGKVETLKNADDIIRAKYAKAQGR
jgi:phosphoribosylcarboxyaminoimidazole (NCAIR) mutase